MRDASSAIVACNVYVTEGRSKDILSKLLESALSRGGRFYRLVHVFCDPRYNRTSFHFVGSTLGIIGVVAPFCWEAWSTLEERAMSSTSRSSTFQLQSETDHPAVGYVDHIAVLPLTMHAGRDDRQNEQVATRLVAMKIGNYLEARNKKTRVLYYGLACPDHTSLATVRRNQTSFFQQQQQQLMGTSSIQLPTVTIGASETFVENYNIRLRCDRAVARTLTKRLRIGLGIEALTLAYDPDNVYEVACNLTNDTTTIDDMERAVSAWQAEQVDSVQILRQYRVGTTALQCQQVWMAPEQEYAQYVATMRDNMLEGL